MAATTVLKFAVRYTFQSKGSIIRGSIGLHNVSSKLILPSLSATWSGISFMLSLLSLTPAFNPIFVNPKPPLLIVRQKSITHFHTSCQARKEYFELTKNRKEGAQHWATERVVAVGLLALIPAGALYPSPIVDYGLAVLLPLHAYWGINAIVADYMWRPAVPVTKAVWLMVSILAGAGLLYINLYDVGICKFTSQLLRL